LGHRRESARSTSLKAALENGSAQESNLPWTLLAPNNGFEVRGQHQHVERFRGGT